MRFQTVKQLIELAESEEKPISEIMIEEEMVQSGRSRQDIVEEMERNLQVMEEAARRGLHENIRSHSGLTGGDAKKLQEYMRQNRFLSGETILHAVSHAMATNEVNAAMGTICATPTAGSAGVVPGCLFAVSSRLNATREQMLRFLFTAGAIGFVIANNSFIAGATGGCQAEIGSATAMAAAAIVEMSGGTPRQCGEAVAISLKNLLGLVCDPVAGLVEVPCVKRNALGASTAMISADMALAGIESVIPVDEVIAAMYRVGSMMPTALKETAMGGLADTPTGRELKEKISGSSS